MLRTSFSMQPMGNLASYWTARWYHFRSELDKLYPDIAAQTWCMQQGLALNLWNSQHSPGFVMRTTS